MVKPRDVAGECRRRRRIVNPRAIAGEGRRRRRRKVNPKDIAEERRRRRMVNPRVIAGEGRRRRRRRKSEVYRSQGDVLAQGDGCVWIEQNCMCWVRDGRLVWPNRCEVDCGGLLVCVGWFGPTVVRCLLVA